MTGSIGLSVAWRLPLSQTCTTGSHRLCPPSGGSSVTDREKFDALLRRLKQTISSHAQKFGQALAPVESLRSSWNIMFCSP